jgi:hypothetical protein
VLEYAIARARRHRDKAGARRLALRRRQLPSKTPPIRPTGGSATSGTPTTGCWGFVGPRREAEDIKPKIAAFLRDELKLELSQSKTLITHATNQAARFLGYEIRAQHSDTKITRGRRAVNGAIGLFVPKTRHQAAVRALHEQGKASATRRAASRRRFHHRREVPGRIRRSRPVPPPGPGRLSPGPSPLGHGDLAAEKR